MYRSFGRVTHEIQASQAHVLEFFRGGVPKLLQCIAQHLGTWPKWSKPRTALMLLTQSTQICKESRISRTLQLWARPWRHQSRGFLDHGLRRTAWSGSSHQPWQKNRKCHSHNMSCLWHPSVEYTCSNSLIIPSGMQQDALHRRT